MIRLAKATQMLSNAAGIHCDISSMWLLCSVCWPAFGPKAEPLLKLSELPQKQTKDFLEWVIIPSHSISAHHPLVLPTTSPFTSVRPCICYLSVCQSVCQ